MAIQSGRDLRLWIGSQPVAYATNCTFSFSKEMLELAPSSSGSSTWSRYKGRRKSCTIGFSALYGTHGTYETFDSLFDAFDGDTDLTVEFKEDGVGNFTYSGTAKLSALSAQAAVSEDGSMTGNLTVTGAVTKSVQ